MYIIIASIIGVLGTISAVLVANMLQNEETRERVLGYLKNRLFRILIITLILILLVVVIFVCFQNKNVVDEKTIRYLVNSLVNAEAKRDSVQKEVTIVTQERDSLRTKLTQLKNEKKELENQLQNQNYAKIDSLKDEISKREDEIEFLEKEISDMNNELKKKKEELRKTKKIITEKEVELRKLKDYLELINTLAMFKLDSMSTNESKNFHKLMVWSDDKQYVAVMYYYHDVGNISIIDLSEKKEIKSIRTQNIYNRIRFSSDNSKLFADSDIFIIKNSQTTITLKPIFRVQPIILSKADVKDRFKKYNFYDYYINKAGSGFANKFESKIIKGNKVIIDWAAGLMWLPGGSLEPMEYAKAKEWIEVLNQKGYSGFHDWRLPTLDEAMTLMERERKNRNLYIEPVFDATQLYIWTSDLVPGASLAWAIFFSHGYCTSDKFDKLNYVRAVRSG